MVKKKETLNEKGEEILDPNPIELPLGYNRPPTLDERIAQMMRSDRLRQYAEQHGMETLDEADDFDVGDDYDPSSPWEMEFDPALGKEVTKADKAFLDAQRREFSEEVHNAKKEKHREGEERTRGRKREIPEDSERVSKASKGRANARKASSSESSEDDEE